MPAQRTVPARELAEESPLRQVRKGRSKAGVDHAGPRRRMTDSWSLRATGALRGAPLRPGARDCRSHPWIRNRAGASPAPHESL